METKRSVAEEAAAKTREAMERAHQEAHAPTLHGDRELEIEDRAPQMALPVHEPGSLIKDHPLEAALGAISLGFLLTRLLPIRAIFGGLLSVAWRLFKPLALLYAGARLARWEKPRV